MGLLGKAALLGAGYYAYKHHSDKKKAQQGMSTPNNNGADNHSGKRDAPLDNYNNAGGANSDYFNPRDNKSQQFSDAGYQQGSQYGAPQPPKY